MRASSRVLLGCALATALAAGSGCRSAAAYFVMPFIYEAQPLAPDRIVRDVPYRDGPAASSKHRLDLFLPADRTAWGWPVVVFVHGGGWTGGDRAQTVGGRDVYGNIGRFFAARGIGAAVVSYRLQFAVTWRDQVDDVARALAWVHAHIAAYGGDPNAIFVEGHSAGAYLALRAVLDRRIAEATGIGGVCGLIPVSGSAFDLADEQTYALGATRRYFERRFRDGDATDAWEREGSVTPYVGSDAPPTLVLYAEDDWAALQRQAERLYAVLKEHDVASRLLEIPDENHFSEVLALSRDGGPATDAILAFVRARGPRCAASASRSASAR